MTTLPPTGYMLRQVGSIVGRLQSLMRLMNRATASGPNADAQALEARLDLLAMEVGIMAEREADRIARAYNAAWESRVASGLHDALNRRLAADFYRAQADKIDAIECTQSHDWVDSPPGVVPPMRVCRKCPAAKAKSDEAAA